MRALAQKPDATGWKRTRFAVVRKSYPDLMATTVKTWRQWFPEVDPKTGEKAFGKMNMAPPMPRHHVIISPQGKIGTQSFVPGIDMEVIFKSVPDDHQETLESLSSLEVTAVWANEVREFSFAIIDRLRERIDRYPQRDNDNPEMFPGATEPGILCDTNSPTDDHWWAIMSGDCEPPEWMTEDDRKLLVKPPGWTFYTQPPAVFEDREQGEFLGWKENPKRENKRYLSKNYYSENIRGKSFNVVRVQYGNQYGEFEPGRPVYPTFERSIHVSSRSLEVNPSYPICWAQDFGRTPSAIFVQMVDGQLRVLGEITGSNMGAERFLDELALPFVARRFGWYPRLNWLYSGDPRGEDQTQADENSPFRVFRNKRIAMMAAPTNDPVIRIGAVEHHLQKMVGAGKPGLLIDPSCRLLISGFEGRYHYKRVAGDSTRYDEKPSKTHPYSDLHDALQYGALRLGAQHGLLGGGQQVEVIDGSYDAMEECWSVV
ncbi:MAG: hypothetical protein GVY22_10345 [Gammaproteobacteria bacterium]|nr:hypothetical protein [Gammaproteobacteria bacterium]